MKYDVAVIGAGPAGSTAAALFARAGHHVLLVDRDSFPREKVCGEFLSWDALPLLDVLGLLETLDDLGCPRIDRGRIAGARRFAEFPLPGIARGVSRFTLDALLASAAQKAGCELLEGHTVTSVESSGDSYRLELRRRSEEEDAVVVARRVFGAWGRWGRLDQQLARSFIRATRRHFGFRLHARAAGYDRPSNVIELHSFDGGYLGVASVEGDLTNVCGLVSAERLRPRRDRWTALERELREERASLQELFDKHSPAGEYISSDPVIFGGKEHSMIGIPFIGDTSGMIDPLTGNGMAMAIQSGALAFRSALRGESDRWDERWSEWFAPRLVWSRTAAALLTRPALVDAGSAAGIAGHTARLLASHTRLTHDRSQRLAHDVHALLQERGRE